MAVLVCSHNTSGACWLGRDRSSCHPVCHCLIWTLVIPGRAKAKLAHRAIPRTASHPWGKGWGLKKVIIKHRTQLDTLIESMRPLLSLQGSVKCSLHIRDVSIGVCLPLQCPITSFHSPPGSRFSYRQIPMGSVPRLLFQLFPCTGWGS